MPEDFESSQERIAAAAARSAEFQNMVREWNMRNQVAFLPGILGQGKATADFYTNQPRTMFVSDRFQPQNVQEYQRGDVADIIPWTGLPEEEGDGRDDGLADETVIVDPDAPSVPWVIEDQVDNGGNDFFTTPVDLVPEVSTDGGVDSMVYDTIAGRGGFDPRTDIGQFLRGLNLNPTIDIDFLTEAIANSTAGMGGPDDWMYLANKIMGRGLYEGDAARSFTGPIINEGQELRPDQFTGVYQGEQGSRLDQFTNIPYSGEQGGRLDQFTQIPYSGEQENRLDQFTQIPYSGEQENRLDQFTNIPYMGEQEDRLDQFTNIPYSGEQGGRLDQFTQIPYMGEQEDRLDQFTQIPYSGEQQDRLDQFTQIPYMGEQQDRLDQFTQIPYSGEQELRLDQFTQIPYSGEQENRLDQFTQIPYSGEQENRLDQFTQIPYSGEQDLRLDQFTDAPIVSEDQGLSPDQFTNAPIRGDNPILDDLGLRGLLTQGSLADFGAPNVEDLTRQYTGDYTPPVSLARFDEASLNEYTRQIGGSEASVPEESPIERILMDVRNNTIPVEDAVTELVDIGLPEDAAVNIIISHTEGLTSGLTSGIPGVTG